MIRFFKENIQHTLHSRLGKIQCLMLFINTLFFIFIAYSLHSYFTPLLLIIFILVCLCLFLLCVYLTLKNKKSTLLIHLLMSIVFIIAMMTIYKTNHFVSSITHSQEYETIQLVTLKESSLTQESSLKDLTMGSYIDDHEGYQHAVDILNKYQKENFHTHQYDDFQKEYKDFLNKKIDFFILSPLTTAYLEEINPDYSKQIKVLYQEQYPIQEIVNDKIDILKEPFTVYLGGVDLSGNKDIRGAGRGDVNILLTVNPQTKKSQLQVIPRDLYCYNPVKKKSSKLSYSGKWGGVQSSIASIEHEFGIKINYYAKINFEGLIELIDELGGIDAYSHYDYTVNGFHYKKGINHLNGTQALAMARERKSLPLNERSRGLQQMEIIKGIMKKVSQNPSFDNLKTILSTIENNFVTNLPEDQFIDAFQLFLDMKDSLLHLKAYSMDGQYKWHDDEIIKGYHFYYFYPSHQEKEKVRNRINDIISQQKREQ